MQGVASGNERRTFDTVHLDELELHLDLSLGWQRNVSDIVRQATQVLNLRDDCVAYLSIELPQVSGITLGFADWEVENALELINIPVRGWEPPSLLLCTEIYAVWGTREGYYMRIRIDDSLAGLYSSRRSSGGQDCVRSLWILSDAAAHLLLGD